MDEQPELVSRGSATWGEWRLGDLADALQSVSRALGPSADVVSASVFPPDDADSLPAVQLLVPDVEALDALNELVCKNGLFAFPMVSIESDRNFHAVLDGVLLCFLVKD